MISRYEVYLNGNSLGAINDNILVLDIAYQPPEMAYDTYTVAKRNGSRIYRYYVSKSTVTITFEIHEYSTMMRQSICQQIQRWAKSGGILTTNDRDGQRLRCVCTQFPVIQSVKKWTEPLTITFTAYSQPFWEDVNQTTMTLTGTNESGTLILPGSIAENVMEVEATPSGTLTSLSLTANGKTLTLSGLSVASGTKVTISYVDDMIQSIKAGNTSILNKRTGVDDLLVNCGEPNSVGFTANVSTTVIFKARGLWA